ncbi:Glycosyl transferase family 2 [Bradyrhizobium sp. STM 3843]|uniref:glycosyltransferase n=1 Tax=Bradyrhizobium sp. STM 3843 TaxID=551947 RepID=UPI0002405344|nr:glycosyltransferase [Bradyrhizobium sp. STM 3843]CCE09384.1 Glycosyl transferase family 2 [Bradyrhizobium sp. STM 3843]
MKFDDVGVVVIGRNEGQRLVDCLESVKAAADHIVYVDSGSTDQSVVAAKQLGAIVVELDRKRPFTAARARNEGFAELKFLLPQLRFVQFVDGDCLLMPGWMESAVDTIRAREDVAIVCGRRRERHPEVSFYNRLCDLEWDTPIGEIGACGGDSLIRVKAFEEAGGFHPGVMAGEEPELCIRLRERGWKIWRIDAEMTLHDAAMTRFGQWWLRSVRSGYGFAEVSRLHRRSPFRIWARSVPSALFWSTVLPLLILLGSLVHPIVLCAILIYPLQMCLIALRRKTAQPSRWGYAFLMVAGKFAQTRGIVRFYWRLLRGQAAQLIEYKT